MSVVHCCIALRHVAKAASSHCAHLHASANPQMVASTAAAASLVGSGAVYVQAAVACSSRESTLGDHTRLPVVGAAVTACNDATNASLAGLKDESPAKQSTTAVVALAENNS